MKLTKSLKMSLLTVSLAFVSIASLAHSPFIAPQSYVVDGGTTTVLGGYAEAAFASEFAISGFSITVTTPQGVVQQLEPQASKYLTIADVETQDEGSYKVVATKDSTIEYAQIKGQWYRIMQAHTDKLPPLTERSFAQPSEVAANAKKISTTNHTQLVSYFSKGQVSDGVLKTTGQGFEVAFSTHPNQLKAGQVLQLSLTANGQPLPNYEVKALKQIQTVADKEVEINVKSNAHGQIELILPTAGQYLLEVKSPTADKKQQPSSQSFRSNIAIAVH